MTATERKIRFDIALETVQRVYDDYCRDQSKTREQSYNFCCFVQDMIRVADTLSKEANGIPATETVTDETKAEHLAKFIAQNWHYCPISDSVSIPNCTHWHSEQCQKCLLANAEHILIQEEGY